MTLYAAEGKGTAPSGFYTWLGFQDRFVDFNATFLCGPGRLRTYDPLIKSQVLLPSELRNQKYLPKDLNLVPSPHQGDALTT